MTESSRVVLGQVAGAHALRGEVRVHVFGDGPENLLRVSKVWLDDGEGQPREFDVMDRGTGRPGEVRLRLSGIADREAAIALRGSMVSAPAEALVPLDNDEYYWHQLVGCEVFSRDDTRVGVVREIWETGAHDVLVVETTDGEQVLLSTARELMPEVDPIARRIIVEELPGMFEPQRLPQRGKP